MKDEKCLKGSTSSLQPLVHNSDHNQGKGHYEVNLAFGAENDAHIFTPTTTTTKTVYASLSKPLYTPLKDGLIHAPNTTIKRTQLHLNKCLLLKGVLSALACIVSLVAIYFWLQMKYDPSYLESFQLNSLSLKTLPEDLPQSYIKLINRSPTKSEWNVEYDIPPGIPVVALVAAELHGIPCPEQKFALVLYVEGSPELAEAWLKECGPNVAYFRIDKDPSSSSSDAGFPSLYDDYVDRLVKYVQNAAHLSLKASLNVAKGENILDNEDFQNTLQSDEIIKSVQVSGYATQKTIAAVFAAVPYVEELTIKGDDVCKSLRRSLKVSEEACQLSWAELTKLNILETRECRGLYDLIYTCWGMPKLETLQVRKSIICSPNAEYIRALLDDYRITKVDFADNVCFDDTLQAYPFMCQASA